MKDEHIHPSQGAGFGSWCPSRRQVIAAASAAMLTRGAMAQSSSKPANISSLAAGRGGASLYAAGRGGVYRSADAGASWDRLPPLPVTRAGSVTSLSVSAAGVPFAAGPGLGVVRNDGTAWKQIAATLPARKVRAVAAHATRAETVYAWVEGRGIYRTEDAGGSWRLMDAGPRGGITSFVHSDMPGSMQTGWLFAIGAQGMRLSMDCFCGWRPGGDLPRAARALAYEHAAPAHVVVAAGTALFESTDGGRNWSQLPDIDAPVDALAFGAAGVLHAAAAGRLYRRQNGAWNRADA